jgi:hypothetical protein
MPRFDYSSDRLAKKQYRGREIPVRVDDVQEKATGQPDQPIPVLTIRFTPPDGALELQSYEGAPDSIPERSDLGKLIRHCAKMEISDIGDNDFAPLIGKFFWLTVQYIKNDRGVEYKRFPTRRMTSDEIAKFFDVKDAMSNVRKMKDLVKKGLSNTPTGSVLISVMKIPEIRPYAGEVSDALDKGEFFDWLREECSLTDNGFGLLVDTGENTDDSTGNTGAGPGSPGGSTSSSAPAPAAQ